MSFGTEADAAVTDLCLIGPTASEAAFGTGLEGTVLDVRFFDPHRGAASVGMCSETDPVPALAVSSCRAARSCGAEHELEANQHLWNRLLQA